MTLEARTPMTEKQQCFVWWSTPESREARQPSVLAIAETVFALALYWGIAIVFDTHLHLVTSLLVAPLLLLRSKRSIAAGVDWFQRDWFGFEDDENWSRARKGVLIGVVAVLGFAVSWWVSSQLAHAWPADQTGLELFLSAASLGMIGTSLGFVAGAGAGAGAVAAVGAMAMAQAVAVAVAGGVEARVGAGVGFAVRTVMIRLAATLRFLLFDGIRSLPENWLENNFIIDTATPAELVPGIGKHHEKFTLNGVINEFKRRDKVRKLLFFLVIPIWFIPVFLYRLNIKSTCWFYWPLAFLLRPLPTDDRSERRQRDLCWPWTNPAQLVLIGLGILWFGVSLVCLLGAKPLSSLPDWPAVSFWLEYLFILDWSRLEP